MGRVPVTFVPADRTVWVEPDTTVLVAGRLAGLMISAPCGGRGTCGWCGVRVTEGELAPVGPDEHKALCDAPKGVRLACRARIVGPVTIKPLAASQVEVPSAAEGELTIPVVAAVDLGTTTVAATTVSPETGIVAGRSVVANAQGSWGADVLSRIGASVAGEADALGAAATRSVGDAVRAAGGGRSVSRIVVAGNTAMAAMLTRADVSSLASHPFTPPEMPSAIPGALIDPLLEDAEVLVVPPIAGFVGGDILAGIVATDMLSTSEPALLVDLGTNAEVVLAANNRLWVASAAAGPAFEAVGVACGGPYGPGSVTSVGLKDDRVVLTSANRAPAQRLSGSGLLSALALLRAAGHLLPDGAMSPEGPLAERFHTDDEGVLRVDLSADGVCYLTQRDVRAVQLAKAAVRTGVESVLRAANVGAGELGAVHVAGAFGAALAPSDLIALGVLPAGCEERIGSVGNASLNGAVAIALDPDVLAPALERVRDATHIDLAADPTFSDALMTALALEPYDV